jgi:hypothetical protein
MTQECCGAYCSEVCDCLDLLSNGSSPRPPAPEINLGRARFESAPGPLNKTRKWGKDK